MAQATAISAVSPLYAEWMSEVVQGIFPLEVRVPETCCAMCGNAQPENHLALDEFETRPASVRGRTWAPNFLVGRILSDPLHDGSPIHALVDCEEPHLRGITPLGVIAPSNYSVLFRYHPFGLARNGTLDAPFLIDAREDSDSVCGVWPREEPICTACHRRFVRGDAGREFWAAARLLLDSVERALQWWSALQLDFNAHSLKELALVQRERAEAEAAGQPVPGISAQRYERLWGCWTGREARFYIEAMRLVFNLQWLDILSLGGPEVDVQARLVRAAYRSMMSAAQAASAIAPRN